MIFKNLCSVLLVTALLTGSGAAAMPGGAAHAEEISSSPDTYAIAVFDSEYIISDSDGGFIDNADTRMTDRVLKLAASSDTEQSYFAQTGLSVDFAEEKYREYDYINFWIYAPDPMPTDNNGNPSELCIMLRTRENSNMRAFYYLLPVDWTGWRLVSIPRADFSNRTSSATWENTTEVKELWISQNSSVITEAASWPSDGSGYVLIYYIYLSKQLPSESVTVSETSIPDGASMIPEDLDGNRTYTLNTDQSLIESTLNTDEIKITENGILISEGYSLAIDKNKINITFDDSLELGSEYIISFDPGSIFDEYGNTFDKTYRTSFTTVDHSSVYKVKRTNPEDGAENVAVDPNGGFEFEITMNNTPSSESEMRSGISVLKNGIKMYDGYNVSVDGHDVKITMDEALSYSAKYTIELSDTLTDSYGNLISGSTRFSFTTADEDTGVLDLLTMDNESSYSGSLSNRVSVTDENTHAYNKALRMEIPAALTPTDTAQLRLSYSKNNYLNVTGYSYINYWIYSEKETESGLNFLCFTSGGNYRYHLTLDWAGWKLVSIPISSFIVLSGTPKWTEVSEIRVDANSYTGYITPWQDGGYILLERIFLSKGQATDFDYIGSSLPYNYSNAPVRDFEIDFTYSDIIGSIGTDAVTVVKAGTDQTVAASAAADGAEIRVRTEERLEYDQKYDIMISSDVFDSAGQECASRVNYSFTTVPEGLSVGKPVFKNRNGSVLQAVPSPGENVVISVTAENESDDMRSASLIVAQYNSLGTMINMEEVSEAFSPRTSGDINCNTQIDTGTVTIRAFVTNGAEKRDQLRVDYGVLGAEEEIKRKIYSGQSNVSGLSITDVKMDVNRLSISGQYDGIGAVLIRMTAPNDEEVLLVPVYASADGIYTYNYTFDDGASGGLYEISVSATDVDAKMTEISYLNVEERNYILKTINESTGNAEIKSLIDRYKDGLNIAGLGASLIDCISETLFEQKPYNDLREVQSIINDTQTLLNKLNSTAWGGMKAFLQEHYGIIMYGSIEYDYYSKLSEANANSINREVEKSMPVTSFAAFREIFDKAAASYRESASKNTGSSGGGGGGGSGGGSGNGSTSAHLSYIPPSNITSQPEQSDNSDSDDGSAVIFSDIDQYSWARSSITRLYELGVISPADDNRFRPGDNVLREEFVKMLVTAFELYIDDVKSSGFVDVPDEAWCQPYLASAKKAGITEGKSDGSFGIGEPITRQDMSVMAYRAAKALNREFKKSTAPIQFTDSSDISKYAEEAVSVMQTAGVLNGMDDGSFLPLANANRAEAAKVIAELIEALK